MKRHIALLLALTLLLSMCFGSIPALASDQTVSATKVSDFCADQTDVLINQSTKVLFSVKVISIAAVNKTRLSVVHDGKTITELNDNGKNGDLVARDGIYSGVAKLFSDIIQTTEYELNVGKTKYASTEISFFKEYSDKDFENRDVIWDKIDSFEQKNIVKGEDSEAVLKKVKRFLETECSVSDVKIESADNLSFVTAEGIPCVYVAWEQTNTVTEMMSDYSAVKEDNWSNSDVLCIRPFYSSGQSGFANQNYPNAAADITAITGGSVTDLRDGQCTPKNVVSKSMDYGFVMIDCHGVLYNSSSFFCVADKSSDYTSADISAKRVVSISEPGYVGITGTYFKQYANGKKYDDTVFYAGSCYGATTTGLSSPLMELGCIAYLGYTESVSFYYEALMITKYFELFGSISETAPGRTYTLSEALEAAKAAVGSYDAYGGYNAALIVRGDTEFFLNNTYDENTIHKVTFDPSNGQPTWTVDVKHNNPVAKPETDPVSNDGAAFLGWYVNGKEYDFTSSVKSPITITARYDRANEIWTAADLANVNNDLSADYIMMADINMNGALFTPIGTDEAFIGTFDGNGHKITNFLADYWEGREDVGLFANNGGTIKNVSVETVTYEQNSSSYGVYGTYNVGIIAGVNTADGIIEHCTAYGNIGGSSQNESTGGTVGGIAGSNSGIIRYCQANTGVEGYSWLGGLAGKNFGTIEKSWSACSINAYFFNDADNISDHMKYIGGIAGGSTGNIIDCYAILTDYVVGNSGIGGMVGWVSGGKIQNVYVVNSSNAAGFSNVGSDVGFIANGNIPTASGIYPFLNSSTTLPNGFSSEIWSMKGMTSYVGYPDLKLNRRDGYITYSVSYAGGLEGVTGLPQETGILYEDEQSFTLPDAPSCSGYDFVGWLSDFNDELYQPGDTVTIESSNITFTAQWDLGIVKYTVQFVDYDGTVISSQEVEIGGTAIPPVDPVREGYRFTGWDTPYTNVQSDLTVTAMYESIADTYTVIFYNYDGTILATRSVVEGQAAVPPADPVRIGYRFIGWDKDISCITSNMVVTAVFEALEFTVTFVDYDDSVIGEQKVKYGKAAIAPEDPAREGYIFSGWDKDFSRVTEDMTVKAQYVEQTEFTVTFVDYDETVLSVQTVEKGNAAEAPEEPAREGYRFVGWDKDFTNVTSDLTVMAVYEEIPEYTVVFVDYDGTVLSTQVIREGSSAEAPEEPAREGYIFAGWDKEFTNITSDLTVTALYTEVIKHIVTFVDYDGTTLSEQLVADGTSAEAPEAPIREGYSFIGWDKEFISVTEDMTITALYEIKVYAVIFVDGITGETISTIYKDHGSSVEESEFPIAPTHEGREFSGWSHDGTNITDNTTITAQYGVITYTITFVDGITGDVISSTAVEHGNDVSFPDTTPIHEGYHFVGWSHDGINITENTIITAEYEINEYTVTFIDGISDQVIGAVAVEHGGSVTFPAYPAHEHYHFVGWSHSGDSIVESIMITALYEIDTYTVIFVDYDGTLIDQQEVAYGQAATAPADPERVDYRFTGWDRDFSNITADIIIEALYEEIIYIPTVAVDHMTVYANENANKIKRFGYCKGEFSDLEQMFEDGSIRYASVAKRFTVTEEGVYSIYVRMLDNREYMLSVEIVNNLKPTVAVDGARVYANSNIDTIMRFGYCEGEYTSIEEMTAAGIRFASYSKAFSATKNGTYTIYILTYDDVEYFYTVRIDTFTDPVVSVDGMRVYVSENADLVKRFGYCAGEHSSLWDMAINGMRLSTGAPEFTANVPGSYTVYLEMQDGSVYYVHVIVGVE